MRIYTSDETYSGIYVKVPMSLIRSNLKPESKLLYIALLNHHNMNGDIAPLKKPLKWYEENYHLTEYQVRNGLNELESKNLIKKEKGSPNSYSIIPNKRYGTKLKKEKSGEKKLILLTS